MPAFRPTLASEVNELKILLIAIALFILACGGFGTNAQPYAQHVAVKELRVGVLRADGALVPFAEYRNDLWWNPWPEPAPIDEYGVAPKSLNGQPEPWFLRCGEQAASWYFWSPDDGRIVLRPQKLLEVENHMDKSWALMTDYPASQTEENAAHHQNIGFAFNVDLEAETAIDVKKDSAEANGILAYIKPAFNGAEAIEVRRIAAEPQTNAFYLERAFPFSRAAREMVELKLTQLSRSRSSIDGQYIYYFESEKQYERPEGHTDWQCYNVSSFKGWLLRGSDGRLAIVNEVFGIADCDRKLVSGSVRLFSIFRFSGRMYMSTVEHGWEDESYIIYELRENEIEQLLETAGG